MEGVVAPDWPTVSKKWKWPSLICTTTIAFSAFRFASIEIAPVAPWKLFVCAIASRIAFGSMAVARPMASYSKPAASYACAARLVGSRLNRALKSPRNFFAFSHGTSGA